MNEEFEHFNGDEQDDTPEDFNIPEEVYEVYCFMYPDKTVLETGGRLIFLWENVKMLKEYNGNEENWDKFRGEKYYITLHGIPNDILVLGNYDRMKEKFFRFRKAWPIFVERGD